MYVAEIVKKLKGMGRPGWAFTRRGHLDGGFWTINSDEFFQFHELGEEPKQIAFSVDDVTEGDWYFVEDTCHTDEG